MEISFPVADLREVNMKGVYLGLKIQITDLIFEISNLRIKF